MTAVLVSVGDATQVLSGPQVVVSLAVMEFTQALLVLAYATNRKALWALRIRGPWIRGIATGVPVGIGLQLAAVVAFLLVQRLVPGFSPDKAMGPIEREFANLSLSVRAALVSIAGIVGPISEELLFRGVLLYGLQVSNTRRGKVFSATVSGLIFALVHLNVWAFVVFFVLGFLLAWMTLSMQTVSYAIGTHIGFNLAALGALAFR